MGEILVWILGVFLLGSILVLERRCLGQRALVQPLALCLLAGWWVDNVMLGIWLGVIFQLFSVAPFRTVDWALAGAVGAITVVVAARLGAVIEVGSIEASSLVLVSVLAGMAAFRVERIFARTDTQTILRRSPWTDREPVRAVEKTVYRAIGRWLILGGLQVACGVGVALACVLGATFVKPTIDELRIVSAVAIPTLGVAVLVSALAQHKLIAWTGLSMGFSFVLYWVVLA